MKRLAISLVLVFVAGTWLACSEDPEITPPPAIDALMLKSGAVAGWDVDDTICAKTPCGTGVEVAKSNAEAEALVNGDATPFEALGFDAFAIEYYKKGAVGAEARIWQMKAGTATGKAIYDYLVLNTSTYKTVTWTDLALGGEAGRIADTGTTLKTNAAKGVYFVEFVVRATDASARTDVEALAKAMVAKLP